jgi:hypothetical protein
MSHLDIERLAMLADDEPSESERVHLMECEPCNTEWRAYRALRGVAAQAPSEFNMTTRLTTWDALATQLREEGLIRTGTQRSASWMRTWGSLAAALLIGAAGVAVGRATATSGESAPAAAASGANGNATLVGNADSAFGTVEEARAALERAEQQYRLASLWLLEREQDVDPQSNPDIYRTRLAALDQMAGTAREAVYEAPHDPVINSYYLNTLAAREVTLKQLNASLKDGEVRRF